MCGRFALSIQTEKVENLISGMKIKPDLTPRYNIAPSQDVALVTNRQQEEAQFYRWGLVPFWAKDTSIGNKLINARSETIDSKPSFRAAFRRNRCLVFADGYYEWKKIENRPKKTPFFIKMKSEKPFLIAGLWDKWTSEGSNLFSTTLITCGPNKLTGQIHDRMPVIIPADAANTWLKSDNKNELLDLLVPFTASQMIAYEVSTVVNNPRNDVKECIQTVSESVLSVED